jgi:hypothetical protein
MVKEWREAQTGFWATLTDTNPNTDFTILMARRDSIYSAEDDLDDTCGDHKFTEG